jgi:hypothetical protein
MAKDKLWLGAELHRGETSLGSNPAPCNSGQMIYDGLSALTILLQQNKIDGNILTSIETLRTINGHHHSPPRIPRG